MNLSILLLIHAQKIAPTVCNDDLVTAVIQFQNIITKNKKHGIFLQKKYLPTISLIFVFLVAINTSIITINIWVHERTLFKELADLTIPLGPSEYL